MTDRAPTYLLGPDFDTKLDRFVDQFVADGFKIFAKEFTPLEQFIERAETEENDRKDNSLRRTAREKYLLELVAFKIYDRLNREAFNRAAKTMIVLPDCLSMHNDNCLKTDEKFGDRCQQCIDECPANEVMDLAEQYGIEVVFSKRKLTEQVKHYQEKAPDLAVIGIGCILMLAEGMRTSADVGVPSRGVLLDYCGCDHWNDQPFGSEFALDRLKEILEEKHGRPDSSSDD